MQLISSFKTNRSISYYFRKEAVSTTLKKDQKRASIIPQNYQDEGGPSSRSSFKLQIASSMTNHVHGTVLHHTVRNLHFLSKNSTLISRENCRFFGGEKLVKMLWFWTF